MWYSCVNFYPESYTLVLLTLAGLLTCVLTPTFPSFSDSGIEEALNICHFKRHTKLTVAGTALVSHQIPF